MSNIKRDLMKEIEARVARKKQLAIQVSQQKTIAKWVAEFFAEYEKVKRFDEGLPYHSWAQLAVGQLENQLRRIDKKCRVYILEEREPPTVEVHWSAAFINTNNCEEVLVFDASSAFFQSAMEETQLTTNSASAVQ